MLMDESVRINAKLLRGFFLGIPYISFSFLVLHGVLALSAEEDPIALVLEITITFRKITQAVLLLKLNKPCDFVGLQKYICAGSIVE